MINEADASSETAPTTTSDTLAAPAASSSSSSSVGPAVAPHPISSAHASSPSTLAAPAASSSSSSSTDLFAPAHPAVTPGAPSFDWQVQALRKVLARRGQEGVNVLEMKIGAGDLIVSGWACRDWVTEVYEFAMCGFYPIP